MSYLCPVCGYDELLYPPENHNICPCCGTQFDYHDCTYSHEQLRERWIQAGAPWHSRRIAPPSGWSANEQLIKADIRTGKANTDAVTHILKG